MFKRVTGSVFCLCSVVKVYKIDCPFTQTHDLHMIKQMTSLKFYIIIYNKYLIASSKGFMRVLAFFAAYMYNGTHILFDRTSESLYFLYMCFL